MHPGRLTPRGAGSLHLFRLFSSSLRWSQTAIHYEDYKKGHLDKVLPFFPALQKWLYGIA